VGNVIPAEVHSEADIPGDFGSVGNLQGRSIDDANTTRMPSSVIVCGRFGLLSRLSSQPPENRSRKAQPCFAIPSCIG